MTMGEVGILNVGAGDTKLSFDPKKPAEVKRARKVVTDMLRSGYAILVQVGVQKGEPIYRRAKAFDPKTDEYIIIGAPEDEEEPQAEGRGKARKTTGARRVKAGETRAIAVARTAGG